MLLESITELIIGLLLIAVSAVLFGKYFADGKIKYCEYVPSLVLIFATAFCGIAGALLLAYTIL